MFDSIFTFSIRTSSIEQHVQTSYLTTNLVRKEMGFIEAINHLWLNLFAAERDRALLPIGIDYTEIFETLAIIKINRSGW